MPPDLKRLQELSAKLGQDPQQIQAAGGNTSLKSDGVMWVKASGFWLKDALSRDMFVPIDLDKLTNAYKAGDDDPVGPAVLQDQNPGKLRPSIETSLHALMPKTFVLHTHSVRTIAYAIRQDWQEALSKALDGLDWAAVPYVMPGLDLANAVIEALAKTPADIMVLGNHGLVVGGDDLDQTEKLLGEIERRLEVPVRAAKTCAPRAGPPKGWRRCIHEQAHQLAFDEGLREQAAQGSFYPDHVIFLGPAASLSEPDPAYSKLWLHPDCGALLPEDALQSADEMALCLALVLARVPEGAVLNSFSAQQEAELTNWDAEKYRQALAKRLALETG